MIPTNRALLLVSNSTNHGEVYLDHCMGEMMDILGGRQRLAFVPFAVFDRESYAAAAKKRFEREGVAVRAITSDSHGFETLEWAEAVFVGGGNTFRLLKALRASGLLAAIRRHVAAGMVYMGASSWLQRRLAHHPYHQRYADCSTRLL